MIQTWSSFSLVEPCSIFFHGWEIAVILRNFRKTKLSKSNFFYLFFLLYFNMYTMCDSTTFALRHTQISLSGILRHFAHQAAIFFCTRMIQTSEPGIRRGNEDSRKNENRKSRKFFFSAENKFTSILCFLNSPSAQQKVWKSRVNECEFASKIDR